MSPHLLPVNTFVHFYMKAVKQGLFLFFLIKAPLTAFVGRYTRNSLAQLAFSKHPISTNLEANYQGGFFQPTVKDPACEFC